METPLNPLVVTAQMMVAAQDGDFDRCASLIQRGADVGSIADSHGLTPLHEAAERGHFEICRLLLASGCDPNRVDDGGGTPFHSAAGQGGLAICQLMVEHGADLSPLRLRRVAENDHTPLQLAVIGGQLDVIRFFAEECDADLDQVSYEGRTLTALAWGCSKAAVATFLPQYWNRIKTERAVYAAVGAPDSDAAATRSRGLSPL